MTQLDPVGSHVFHPFERVTKKCQVLQRIVVAKSTLNKHPAETNSSIDNPIEDFILHDVPRLPKIRIHPEPNTLDNQNVISWLVGTKTPQCTTFMFHSTC